MANNNNNNNFNEYCTGVPSADGSNQCLHMAMFYRPHNHPNPEAHLTPIEYNFNCEYELSSSSSSTPQGFTRSPSPSPSPCPCPCPCTRSPSPPLPPPPPPPPVVFSSSPIGWPRRPPTLPPLSSLLPRLSAAELAQPASPAAAAAAAAAAAPPRHPYPAPPPYTRQPHASAPTPSTRFQVFHVRYSTLDDGDKIDSVQDQHKLFVLTKPNILSESNSHIRGLYLHLLPTATGGLCYADIQGDLPPHTPCMREQSLLGTVTADELERLQDIGLRVQQDRFPSSAKTNRKPATRSRARNYTASTPPPPYHDELPSEPVTAPSREWVVAVIDVAVASGVLIPLVSVTRQRE